MSELNQIYKDLTDELGKVFYNNPLLWGKRYFKHHFRKKSPAFHYKILKLALSCMRLAIAAPRGSAKSTIILFLYLIHAICFRKRHYILILSNTFGKAADSLETVKIELKGNEMLKGDYPIEVRKDSYGDSIFVHPCGFEVRVKCYGAEQMGGVRGTKFGAYRPDLILVDDLEDDEMVRNPDRRRQLKETYDEALVPAGEEGVTQIIVIGTILHDDALITELVSKEYYPEYRKLKYKGRFEANNIRMSLWKEWKTVEQLDEWEQLKPEAFAKECQNDPVSGLLGHINRTDFRYWTIENGKAVLFDDQSRVINSYDLHDCIAAIGCDLAWEEKKVSDYTAIVPCFLTPNSDILVDTYVCKKGVKPDELKNILFPMEARLRALTGYMVHIGFEKAKQEKIMKWFLKKEMREENRFLTFKALLWDKDKITRIITRLQPRYSQHTVFHRRGMGELEHQLIRIPSGTHDDLPDALQGAVQLLKSPKTIRVQQDAKHNPFKWWQNTTVKQVHKGLKGKSRYNRRTNRVSIPAIESPHVK